jgi:hypothetical protein
VWCYAYWNLFRCKPIRDVPSSLSLYNYKLSGVNEGMFSFSKLSHDVSSVNEIEMAEQDNTLSVTIADTADRSGTASNDPDKPIDVLPNKVHAEGGSEIEVVRPHNTESDELRKAEGEIRVTLQELQALEAEKRQLSALLPNSAAPATAANGGVSDRHDPPLNMVTLPTRHRSLSFTYICAGSACCSEAVVRGAWSCRAPPVSSSLPACRTGNDARGQQQHQWR